MNVSAQKTSGEVTYSQITTVPKIKVEIGKLFFNSNNSLYLIQKEKEITKIQKLKDGTTLHPSNTIDSIANKTRFIFFEKNKSIFYSNIINNDTEVILKDYKHLVWNILPNFKTILNFNCQKAETKLNNKKYIAWFSKEIPGNYGPIKINGLNGLILELHTEDDLLKITATSIIFKNVDKNINKIKLMYDFGNAINSSEYSEVFKAQNEIFEKKINDHLSEGQLPIKFGDIDCKECNK